MEENNDLLKAKKIEKQVERWDLFAKLAPTLFLFVCFILLATGISQFEILFVIGMTMFSLTAVTWWFWTIFSIRYLVKLFYNATDKLIRTGAELESIRTEYKDIQDEKNNSG